MTPLLEFDRVSKWFRDTVAVGDVSFSIEAGVTGLLGHNGAGKSTAIRLATGLARPDEGAVRVLGRDPRRSGDARAAIGLGDLAGFGVGRLGSLGLLRLDR